jgi:Flp pilus assembly pilin Flp
MIKSLLTIANTATATAFTRARAPAPALTAAGDAASPEATDQEASATLVKDQRGALTFIEWVIIFAVVIVVIAIAAGELATTVSDKFGEVGDTVEGLETNIN